MGKIKDFLASNSYYIFLICITVLLMGLTRIFKLDNLFLSFYEINGENINTSLITIFTVFFAFVFTVMAIVFSLSKDSFFVKLIEENDRNKRDVINYFILAIFSFFLVLLTCSILTVMYSESLMPFSSFEVVLIYFLVYLIEFSLINLLFILVTFIQILKK